METPSGPNVLVVEDEELIRRLVVRAVEKAGGTPRAAADCSEARALMKQFEFACALLDKNLPDGDGLELLFELRKQQPQADATILTGYANVESAIDALRAGATNYLTKPFSIEMVQQQVHLALERGRARTEAQRAQQLLVHADRMAAIGLLAAGIAHELRSPLTLASLSVDLLEQHTEALLNKGGDNGDLREQIQESIARTRRGIHQAARISQDLKGYSRPDDEVRTPVALVDALEGAIEMATVEIRPKAQLVREFTAFAVVDGSRTRLEQVFVNLLVNAAQALPAGGGTRNVVRVSTRAEGERVVVEVSDTGPGIAPENLARVFEPFFTTKPVGVGTGLGLHVCKSIVEWMGGEIAVDSKVGVGTRVSVLLPALKVTTQPASTVVSGG